MMKWSRSATFQQAVDELRSDVVSVDLSAEARQAGAHIAVAREPVTNEAFARIVNATGLWREMRDNYYLFNHHNPANPLRWDADGRRLVVRSGYERHPVTGVSWFGAREFALLVGGRLPYASEWEYLASAGGRYRYPWGDDPPSPTLCNYGELVGSTTPVGRYPPSCLGFYDLAGNVGEWCLDAKMGTGVDMERLVKGGSWNRPGSELPCTARRSKWGRIGTASIGFRLVWGNTV